MDLSAISPLLKSEAASVLGPIRSLDEFIAGSAASTRAAGAAGAGAPPVATSDAFREVLSRYDVTRITPREFSELLQKLRDVGAIDEAQFQELQAIRADLDAAETPADEPLDLMRFYADRLGEQQTELARLAERAKKNPDVTAEIEQALAATRGRIEWLQKFHKINTGFEPTGVDLLA